MLLKTFKLKNHIVSQFSITLGKKVLFSKSMHSDGGWFRILGRGITWTNRPLFSTRNGFRKSLKIKGYYITLL